MANMTITTTAGQDARIVAAFGKYLGLKDGSGNPRNATGAEVKQEVINFIKLTVIAQEKTAAVTAAAAAAEASIPDVGAVS